MDCFCRCGTTLRSRQTDLNQQAATVALELLAWDKARAAGQLDGPGRPAATRVIERGADCYQTLLDSLHRGESSLPSDPGATWLSESLAERRDREYMTLKGGFLSRHKLLLTEEDYDCLDRVRPEGSFSGALGTDGPAGPAVPPGSIGDDLERLARLFETGALSAAEFEAAKAQVLRPR